VEDPILSPITTATHHKKTQGEGKTIKPREERKGASASLGTFLIPNSGPGDQIGVAPKQKGALRMGGYRK